jgi:hypothetical protein
MLAYRPQNDLGTEVAMLATTQKQKARKARAFLSSNTDYTDGHNRQVFVITGRSRLSIRAWKALACTLRTVGAWDPVGSGATVWIAPSAKALSPSRTR